MSSTTGPFMLEPELLYRLDFDPTVFERSTLPLPLESKKESEFELEDDSVNWELDRGRPESFESCSSACWPLADLDNVV